MPITVDRLSLRLPAGFGARATRIAQLTARELANLPAVNPRLAARSGIQELHVPSLAICRGLGDQQVVTQIVAAIQSALAQPPEGKGGGGGPW